jgi:hypothetical protein
MARREKEGCGESRIRERNRRGEVSMGLSQVKETVM